MDVFVVTKQVQQTIMEAPADACLVQDFYILKELHRQYKDRT